MKTILSLLLSISSILVYSQAIENQDFNNQSNNKRPSFYQYRLGVQLGPAMPMGEFSKSGVNDREAGFAENGLNIEGNYNLFLDKNIGISFGIGHSNYGVNTKDYDRALRGTPGLITVSSTAGQYSHLYYTFGLKLIFGQTSKFYLNPVIGGSLLTFPEFKSDLVVQDTSGQAVPFTLTQFSSESTALIYGINAGFDTYIDDFLSLQVNFQYYSLEYEFDGYAQASGSGLPALNFAGAYDQPFKTINLTIGLGYHFN